MPAGSGRGKDEKKEECSYDTVIVWGPRERRGNNNINYDDNYGGVVLRHLPGGGRTGSKADSRDCVTARPASTRQYWCSGKPSSYSRNEGLYGRQCEASTGRLIPRWCSTDCVTSVLPGLIFSAGDLVDCTTRWQRCPLDWVTQHSPGKRGLYCTQQLSQSTPYLHACQVTNKDSKKFLPGKTG